MKNFRLFSIIGIVFFCLGSCDQHDTVTPIKQEVTRNLVQSLSGEDIFRALYFYEGPAVELIPSIDLGYFNRILETFTEQDLEEYADFKDEIVTAIGNQSDDFFAYYEQEMTSGNHLKVKKAMDRSMFEYQKAILSIDKYAEAIHNIDPIDLRYENFLDEDGNFQSDQLLQRIEEVLGEDFFIGFDQTGNKGTCILLGIVVVAYVGAAVAVVVGVAAAIVLAGAAGTYLAVGHEVAGGTYHQPNRGNYDASVRVEDPLRIEAFIHEITVAFAR